MLCGLLAGGCAGMQDVERGHECIGAVDQDAPKIDRLRRLTKVAVTAFLHAPPHVVEQV